MQVFLSTWDNVLNPNFNTYFKFNSESSDKEFIHDMQILEALKLSSSSMVDSPVGAFYGDKKNRESYFKILKNTISTFDRDQIENYKSIYPLWKFYKGKTLENPDEITNIDYLKEQKKLYENNGESELFKEKLKTQLDKIKDKRLTAKILYFLASEGYREFWDILINDFDTKYFDKKQLEVIATIKVLKQRSYFFLRAQYYNLLNDFWEDSKVDL